MPGIHYGAGAVQMRNALRHLIRPDLCWSEMAPGDQVAHHGVVPETRHALFALSRPFAPVADVGSMRLTHKPLLKGELP
jgi:hypothetical protein